MANKLDPMDLRQIITLHLDGLSNRKVADYVGISRNTVNEYIQRFDSSDYSIKELSEMDTGSLEKLFPSLTTIDNDRYNELMTYFEKVNVARNHPGFTFQYHYQQYRVESGQPYSYTQFMEHYHRKHSKIKGSMKLEHEAGREVFIDFTGKKLHITDKETGDIVPVEVFVAILPNSQYTYVEACMSQKREDLVNCMGNALSFYGGVPKAIVCDNLKSAVTRSHKYEPEINKCFKEFALHYNCVVNPTRTYSPQDKALVENAVHLAYQRIFYPIREMTFFSLSDLNKEIKKLLERYNDLLFQRKSSSRKELFQSVERGYLKPLPDTPYELKDYRRAKVQKMGYVYFSPDRNYYSVPYRYIGKHTQIHYTQKIVEVYYHNERIAIHPRSPSNGIYITEKDHLSSTHRVQSDWSPAYFKNLARKHGAYVEAFVDALINASEYPEISYKRSMGVIQLSREYGSIRLNKACKKAIEHQLDSFHVVKNILKNKVEDQIELFDPDASKTHIPNHENIRGASAYQ